MAQMLDGDAFLEQRNELRAAETITLYARWKKCRHPSGNPYTIVDATHSYDIPIRPKEPLQVGRRVRILALSRRAYTAPEIVFPRYDTYDPHVVGTIVAAVGRGDVSITYEIANECPINPVKQITVTLRYTPGITVTWTPEPAPEREDATLEGAYHGDGPGRWCDPFETGVVVAVSARARACGAGRCEGLDCSDRAREVVFVTGG